MFLLEFMGFNPKGNKSSWKKELGEAGKKPLLMELICGEVSTGLAEALPLPISTTQMQFPKTKKSYGFALLQDGEISMLFLPSISP